MEPNKAVLLVQKITHGIRWRFFPSYEKVLCAKGIGPEDRMISCPNDLMTRSSSEQREFINQNWDVMIPLKRIAR